MVNSWLATVSCPIRERKTAWYFLLKGCNPIWDKTQVRLSSTPVASFLSLKKKKKRAVPSLPPVTSGTETHSLPVTLYLRRMPRTLGLFLVISNYRELLGPATRRLDTSFIDLFINSISIFYEPFNHVTSGKETRHFFYGPSKLNY